MQIKNFLNDVSRRVVDTFTGLELLDRGSSSERQLDQYVASEVSEGLEKKIPPGNLAAGLLIGSAQYTGQVDAAALMDSLGRLKDNYSVQGNAEAARYVQETSNQVDITND
jgi:hypothetical protein